MVVETEPGPSTPRISKSFFRYGVPALALLMLVSPFLLREYPYMQQLLVTTMIFGIMAMALDLLLGFTGMVSLGQAAFSAVAAYSVGILWTKYAISEMLVTLPAAILASALFGLVTGYFAVKSRDIYFLMLTLAFSMMVAAGAHKWTWLTGGDDGLRGIARPTLFGIDLSGDLAFFYVVAGGFLLSAFLLRRVVQSPFGQVLVGIRENEHRVASLGYNTRLFKLAAFILSGAVSGFAGWLFVGYNQFVSPSTAEWHLSGLLQLMVIIGGAGTLTGPVIGTALVFLVRDWVSSYTERWQLILGVVFILFVMLAPQGIAGLASGRQGSVRRWLPWKR